MDMHLLEAADARLADRLTSLVNTVYETSEEGLWRDGATRTTPPEMAELIAAGEIVVAECEGEIAGSVRVHDVAEDASEFGMLVAAPEHRSTGVGRALVDFAEDHTRARGMRAMRLELLVPREREHPSKEFLEGWYGRRGYRVIHTSRIDDQHPHLAPLLATPCDMLVYEKPLRSTRPG